MDKENRVTGNFPRFGSSPVNDTPIKLDVIMTGRVSLHHRRAGVTSKLYDTV
jgi:hypothetical protein